MSIIVEAVQSGNYPYKVGDTKHVDMGTFGEHIIRVANTTKCSEVTVESKTACGFVLEFSDIITNYNMNPAGEYNGIQYDQGYNAGGWPASEMRTYVNNDIYNALPEELRKGIIETYVVSSRGDEDITNYENVVEGSFYSTDKLYLLSPQEVYGTSFTNQYDSSNGTSRQLDYYEDYQGDGYTGVSTTNYEGAIKQNAGSNSRCWLRSALSANGDLFNGNRFYAVNHNGIWFNFCSYYSYGVSPAFRLAD